MSILMLVELCILVITALFIFYYIMEVELPKSVIAWILVLISIFIIYARLRTGNFGNTLNVVKTLLSK